MNTNKTIEAVPMPKSPRFRDLRGQTFGLWVVLQYAGRIENGRHSLWWCRCECGTVRKVQARTLVGDESKSCGCEAYAHRTVHGGSDTPEYISYKNAAARCNQPSLKAYPDYGGRGIEFRFDSFEAFLQELGTKPTPRHTVDRIDNDGHYEPGNVRWVTYREQANNRRSNLWVTVEGVRLTTAQWARKTGISPATICNRRKRGWCIQCAVTTPPYGHTCRHKEEQ